MTRTAINNWSLDASGLWITCPGCGDLGRADHTVEPNGEVNPSLVCPATGCTFHAMAKLVGWTRGRVDASKAIKA